MASLIFNLLDKSSGIYVSADTTNKVLTLYYLASTPPQTSDPVEFSASWQSNDNGYYFFLHTGATITDFPAFATALKAALGPANGQGLRWIAWIDNPAVNAGTVAVTACLPLTLATGGTAQTTAESNIRFLNILFNVPTPTNLNIGGTGEAPVFQLQVPATGPKPMSLQNKDILDDRINPRVTLGQSQVVGIPLTGAHIGVLQYAAEWDRGVFYNLFITQLGGGNLDYAGPSAELRFQYNKSQPVTFRYPFFIGQIPMALPPLPHAIFLNVSMDALNPLDGNRTRFAFDLGKFSPTISLPTAKAFRSNTGKTLYLNPKPDPADGDDPLKVAGFSVAIRPNESDQNKPVLYLVPIGNYAVEPSSPPPATPGIIDIMCGLAGTEFLLAATGDLLEFSNGAKSLAVGYDPDSQSNTDDVDDTYTTAWVRLIPGPNSGTVFTGPIKESYCIQAPDSVYYSPASQAGFSLAAGIRLANLADTTKTVPFPMVPYGDVYHYDQRNRFQIPNLEIPASTLSSFEFEVLSPLRRQTIQPDLCIGPIFFNAANGMPLQGGYVRTPIGLLAELNDGTTPANTPAGTLKRLILAKSPVNGKYLQFRAAPSPYCGSAIPNPPTVVRPKLSTALLQNSVFLVATNASLGNIGPFDNEIQLGEFTFQVNLTGQPLANADGKMTIMLFKFSTSQAVEQLAANTSKWTDPADFVGDASAVSDVSARIVQSIAEAKAIVEAGGTAASYFQDFYAKMTDPAWTGMIVLNCELDYQLLPIDLQVLLGGIDGELTAHHFGVTVNQIEADQPADLDIDNSSLFSLIYYDKIYQQTPKTFDFQVTKLNVLYVNSVLANFQSQIAMTVKELYGDSVSLAQGGPNDILDQDAILIDGVYLKDGESGHLVFDSADQRFFSFPHNSGVLRVLENVILTDAALVPVSAVAANGTTIVKAAFRLNGAFGFTADVSTDKSAVDLFSYPINPIGGPENKGTLNFKYNDLVWDTSLNGNQATLQYPIVPDLTNLQLESNASAPRDNSLIATFPLNLSGFKWSPGGLSAEALGAKQVSGLNTLQADDNQTQVYALVFSLPMGNLGMLSSGIALQATVYLGWSPASGNSNGNDISLFFVPPTQFSSGDGGFKLQGVIETVYGDLILNRFPLTTGGNDLLFVLQLEDIQFTIISFPLIYYPRTLTLFGDPNKPKGSNLSWFLSNPGGSHSPISAVVTPIAGVMNGLKIDTDLTGTRVISTAINNLTTVSSATDADVIQSIRAQQKINDTSFEYDPSAGVLFFVDLEFLALTFKLLMADPSFYGGLLTLGAAKPGEDGFLKKWGGLELELDYRKISDGLGLWSVDFTVPKSIRVIPNAQSPTNFTLPSFGLEIYTNGDFRIEVGWPFGSGSNAGEPAKLSFVVEGVPLFVSIGLYIAKLRGADVPGTFPPSFKLIYMFGLGLAFGIDAKYPKDPKDAGVITAEFQLFIWGTFQGMLVSKTGSIGKDGLDYQWWAATVGVTLNISGTVNLKIIVISIVVEATIYVSLAIETGHSTIAEVGADLKVTIGVKILFFTIHITFTHHFTLETLRLGSGPDALLSGPTPCLLPEYQAECGKGLSQPEPMPRSAALAMPQSEATPQSHTGTISPEADTPVPITIYYLLQPTTLSTDGQTWAPQVVSSLLIEFDPSNADAPSPTAKKPFSNLLYALANNLASQVPSSGTFGEQVAAMTALVHGNAYFDQADRFLKTGFVFTIEGNSALTADINVAVFPMFPQCQVNYNGITTAFNGPVVPADYVQLLQQYLNQYSSSDAGASGTTAAMSVAEMLFKDYFVMLAQQLVYELQQAANGGATNLGAALKSINYANIAGFVSHFMLHGLRLPTFSGNTVNLEADWQGMYQLAGLQTPLVKNGANYVTAFTLGLAETAQYIAFASGKTTLEEDFPLDQVLDQAPSLDWLSTPGGGISALNPLAASQKTYHLAQPNSFIQGSNTTQLFPIPNAMQRELEQVGGMQVALSLIADEHSGTSKTTNQGSPVSGIPALFIPISIKKVALPNSPGGDSSAYYPNTYAIEGIDQYTRELLGLFLTEFDAQAALTFMIGTGNNNYQAPASTNNLVLVKNNLSTDAEPNTELQFAETQSALGPVQATLDQVQAFLRLVWEESVVNTAGYYLHLENLPDTAFTGETANIALLVSSGTAADTIALKAYHNLVAIGEALDKGALVAAVMDSTGNPILAYQPNYAPGYTGFTARWLNAPIAPDIKEQGTYIEALYRTVQFKVNSIEGATPPPGGYNWSMPTGANSIPGAAPDTTDWFFRQNIPAFKFIGTDPYAAVGKKVTLDIRILDTYGNELPENLVHQLTTTILYNDPLTAFAQLQWFQIGYAVNPGKGNPVLGLTMGFDADTVANILAGGGNAQQQIEQVMAQYLVAIGQLNDPNTSLLLNTSLSGNGFAQDNTGTSLKASVQTFLQGIVRFLQNPSTTPPPAMTLNLDLDFDFVRGLKDDLFVVEVEAVLARAASQLDPAVTNLLPSVGSVTNTLLPYVTPGASVLTDTPSLSAFAEQFEMAYEGFDGADGQIKIGKGADFSSGLQNAKKSAIWAIKWSKTAGLDIDIPFASAPATDNHPVFYAPPPLSTQLITRTESVIKYKATGWDGSNSDIDNGDLPIHFTNIDLDAWASQFLNAFHGFITPEMAAAVAKLDSGTYENLMQAKNQLATAIAYSIAQIITPESGQLDSDLTSAQEKMLQSLLSSLTNDYDTSALVQVPAQVVVNGEVEPGADQALPTVFGRLSTNALPSGETPYTVSNAALPLANGTQYLNFLVSAKHPEQQTDLNLNLFYDIGFLQHQLETSEAVDGFVPSSWVTVVLPARAANGGKTPPPLQVPLSTLDIPIPLRSFPAAPIFNTQAVVVNPDATNIEQLLQWAYTLEVNRPDVAQDDLILEVSFNEGVDSKALAPQAGKAVSLAAGRPAPTDLFEALARFAYEYPEIQPYLDKIPNAAFQAQEVPVATAALSRMNDLIEGVAAQWPNWQNPAVGLHNTPLRSFTGSTPEPGIQPIDQRYQFVCSEDGKTITVTGLSYTSAQDSKLSDLPYPDITGYTKGTMNNNIVLYTLNAPTAPTSLQLSFGGLNIGTHQSAIARAYIERNVDIAPAGFTTNPAFVFRTTVVSFKNPIVPLIEVNTPIALPAAPTLSNVISAFFNDFLGDTSEAGTILELQFSLEAGAEFLIASNPFKPGNLLVSQTPILFSQMNVATPSNTTGVPATKLNDYTTQLTQQILNWHQNVDPDSPTQEIYLSFTLFADVSASKLPLLRIRELTIAPPQGNPRWWA